MSAHPLKFCPQCKRHGLAGAHGVYSCLYCGKYIDRRKTKGPFAAHPTAKKEGR